MSKIELYDANGAPIGYMGKGKIMKLIDAHNDHDTRVKNLEDDSYCYANHLKVLEQKLAELTHPPNDIKPEHQHRTENLIADPEDLTTESWPVDDGVRPLPTTAGHWECDICGEIPLDEVRRDDARGHYHLFSTDSFVTPTHAVKWVEPKAEPKRRYKFVHERAMSDGADSPIRVAEPKADLSDYSPEAQESILHGLKQKGDIDLGSFAEFANTENNVERAGLKEQIGRYEEMKSKATHTVKNWENLGRISTAYADAILEHFTPPKENKV